MKPTAIPVSVSIELGLDSIVDATYRQYNEDGDYSAEPLTLLDAVIERLATMLLGKLVKDEQQYTTLRNTVRARAVAMIDERLTPMIEETFEKGIPVTNGYGELVPGAKAVTMRELVIAEVGKHLVRRPNARYESDKTTFDKYLDTCVAAVVQKELAAEVAAAKKVIKATVAASAAEVLSAAILDGVTGRG